MNTLWVACGGAMGTVLRYHLGLWLQRGDAEGFPRATLTVNLIGSFAISAIMVATLREELFSPTWRTALTAGVLGGFTTYSSFNYETLALVQRGAWGTASWYVATTVCGGLLAGLVGAGLARAMTPS